MNKKSIVVLVIAGVIVLGGQILSDLAKDQIERIEDNKHWVGGRRATIEERERDLKKTEQVLMLSKYSIPLGVILGSAGALWLIVSAIQGGKKKK